MIIGIIIIGALIAIPLLVMNLGANKAKNNYLTAYNTAYDTAKTLLMKNIDKPDMM